MDYLRDDILGKPPLPSEEMQALDDSLTELLRTSNSQKREGILDFLKRWEIRVLFVDALQEAKDLEDAEADGKGK